MPGQMACISLIKGARAALVGTGNPEKNVDVILSQGELRGSEVPLCLKPGPKRQSLPRGKPVRSQRTDLEGEQSGVSE